MLAFPYCDKPNAGFYRLPVRLTLISYQVYNPSNFEGLRKLFSCVWGQPRSIEYDQKHWNSTLLGTAPGIVAMAEGRIIGFYTVWPVPLSDGTEVVLGGQPIDSMVDPQFQGRGLLRELGSRCYSECARRSISVMYGAPNKAALAGNVGGLNWAHVCDIVEHVRPLFSRRRAATPRPAQVPPFELDIGRTGAVNVHAGVPDEVSALLTQTRRVQKVWSIASSDDWYRYRYATTPDVSYVSLTLEKKGIVKGVAVCGMRVKDLQSGRLAKITIGEIEGYDEASRRAVVRGTISLAKSLGAPYIQVKSAGRSLGATLLTAGFVPYRRTPLISRTLDANCHGANPFIKNGWALFGGAFDTI